jgi:alpha-beta hydrolase superfamily lysophospholipase
MRARSIDLRVDVTGSIDVPGRLETAVTVHVPDRVPDKPIVVFAFPGGGYSRGYFDIRRPELPGPTQVDFHTDRGFVVVACDHLGVGDSSHPEPDTLTFGDLADANHATVTSVLDRLADGTLDPTLAPIVDPSVVGVGHSMGGCLGVVQQARHATFAALAVLGYSGARMFLRPPPLGVADQLRWLHHWDETPAALVDDDMGGGAQHWRSATMPACVLRMGQPGRIAAEAAAIEAPLFLAAGERDVIEDLYAEPDAFRSSRHITLYLLPRSAHMHNFAPTRELLWRRLHAWITSLHTP